MGKSTVLSRFNSSVNEAVKEGRLDRKKHGALIEAARKLAETMDRPGWPVIDGKFDNVTPSTYKQYCETLHLTPAPMGSKLAPVKKTNIVGNSRWKKQA